MRYETIKRFGAPVWALALILAMGLGAVPAAHAEDYTTPASFTELAKAASKSVVNIRTEKSVSGGQGFRRFSPFGENDPFKDFFEKFFGDEKQREFKQRSLGSGFIVDKKGYIVTNNHVIEEADEIQVKLNNDKDYDGEIIGRDPSTDLALIKIEADEELPVLELGDSDALEVGEWVVAIGNPFGLEHTVTSGIVSAKGRVIGSGPYDDFIQTDASINPGNSGGPLLNMKGQVVGINTAIIAGGQGIGFAVPVNLAKGVLAQLKTSGEVTRGWLGVAIQDLDEELAEYYGVEDGKGVLVTEVFEGDPAEKAGIAPKDIIVALDGKPVADSRELTRMVADIDVGKTVTVKVIRDGDAKKFPVKVGKRDMERVFAKGRYEHGKEDALGLTVSEITPDIARRFNINDRSGVIVTEVEPESKADEAGFQPGDLIKEINRESVADVGDYRALLADIDKGRTVQFFVKRMNRGFVVIKLEK